jgi:hypothetical protein
MRKKEEEPGLKLGLLSLSSWTDHDWLEQYMMAANGYSFDNCIP